MVIEKVVAYITNGQRLLVFRHVAVDAGVQVPAGTLESGESPEDGALREAREETGLVGLTVRRSLGSRDYDMSPYGTAEWHRRHYYHFECSGDAPETWRHFESHPAGHAAEQIEFEFFWVTLPLQALVLAAGQGDFLEALRASMRET